MRCLTALLALCLAAPAAAEPQSGAALFRQTCATCHGLTARGDGPMAAVLTVPVPDLTLIATRNDGTFPLDRVVAAIDGRTELTAHGGPMPVYGFSLGGAAVALTGPDGAEIRTGEDIAALADWLASVQR